jgi:hypothetical protein
MANDVPGIFAGDACMEEKTGIGTPRRRARLRVDESEHGGVDLSDALYTAADPNRFAGLEERWFWTDVFQIPRRKSWAEENAVEVAAARAAGLTMEKLAEQFGKTVPTIRAALRFAASVEESVRQLPRKMPRRRWHEEHAREVAAKKADGLGTGALAAYFGKSDTTIRAALDYARQAADTVLGVPAEVAASADGKATECRSVA